MFYGRLWLLRCHSFGPGGLRVSDIFTASIRSPPPAPTLVPVINGVFLLQEKLDIALWWISLKLVLVAISCKPLKWKRIICSNPGAMFLKLMIPRQKYNCIKLDFSIILNNCNYKTNQITTNWINISQS